MRKTVLLFLILNIIVCGSALSQKDMNDTLFIHVNQRISKGLATSNDYVSRAYFLAKKDQYKKSLKDLNKAIELRVQNPNDTLHLFRAELYLSIGDYDKVLPEALVALEINNKPHNLYEILELAYLIKDYDECIRYANAYLKIDKKNPKVFYYKGASLLAQKELNSLVSYNLKKALKLKEYAENPEKLKALSLYQLGLLFYRNEQWDSALVCFLDIYENQDSLIEPMNLYYGIGESYFFNKEYSKAIDYLSKHTAPQNWNDVQYFLGRSYEYLKSFEQASMHFSEIIENRNKENTPYATLHRGICQFELGNIKEALKDLKKAKRKWYQEEPLIYIYLSQCYWDLKKQDKACSYLNTGLKLSSQKNSENQEVLFDLLRKYKCQ